MIPFLLNKHHDNGMKHEVMGSIPTRCVCNF